MLKRLHSISGVVPVGVFLVEHLWTNASALQGEDAFSGAVGEIQALPLLPAIEVLGIFLPLAYHALYGVHLAFKGRQNALQYSYARNWLYLLQRASGLIALAFIVYHLEEFRVQKWLFGMQADAFYPTLEAHLSATRWGVPWAATGYLIGLAAAVFHFANGLSGFAISWGITATRAAQQRMAAACWVIGLALFGLGAVTVLFFATGSRFYLQGDAVSSVPPPAMACPPATRPP